MYSMTFEVNKKYIGSICLLILFISSGVNKFINFNSTVTGLLKKTFFNIMPKIVAQLAIVFAIVLLIFGSITLLYIIYNKKENVWKVMYTFIIYAFIIFTILATLLYHNFYIDPSQKIHFMKNLAIIGGFLLLL